MKQPKLDTVVLPDGNRLTGYEGDALFGCIRNNKTYFEQSQLEKWFLPRAEKLICIYDIGANLGNHTIYFATHSAARIFSFEPMPATFAMLKRNVDQNGLSERVKVFPFALGEEDRSGQMQLMRDRCLGCASIMEEGENTTVKKLNAYRFANRKIEKDGKVVAESLDKGNILKDLTGKNIQDVSIKRLDELTLPPPDFIKMDVEEYELKVLKGMERTLRESSPDLWIEIHGNLSDNKEKWNLLGSLGYVPVDFEAPWDFIFSKTGTQESESFWKLLDIMHSAAMDLKNKNEEQHQLMRESYEKSNSWKITAPLRAIRRVFRRY